MSDSLWPRGLQHARPPCPSPTPRICSNSCPLSRWCHPTISSSVVPFSSCLQSFPASRYFQMSQFFASGGQSVGFSASASVFPMSIQDWFPSGWTGWISLQSKGLSRVFSNTTVQKHQFFSAQLYIYVYIIYKVNIFQCKIYNWFIVTLLSGQGNLNRERLNSFLPEKVGLLKINIFCSLPGSFAYMRQEQKQLKKITSDNNLGEKWQV